MASDNNDGKISFKVTEDKLNQYATECLNKLLNKLGLEQIDGKNLNYISFNSVQDRRPETSIFIISDNYEVLRIKYKSKTITSTGWEKTEFTEEENEELI